MNMNSEQQYIDFFQSQKQAFDKLSVPAVNAMREEAFAAFQRQGFPVYNSENYQHTNIPELLGPDFGFNIGKTGQVANPFHAFRCFVPNLSPNVHFVVNDRFFKEEQNKNIFPEGVFSGSMNDFALQYPEIFSKHYHKLAIDGDGLAAFNTMFVQDGYVLYVPKNVVLEKPIQIINVLRGQVDSLINRRMLIIIESGAQAKILICDHSENEDIKLAVTQVTEIFVGENAVFDFYELEESSENTIRLTSNFVRQAASSNVMVDNIALSNGITRNNYNIALEGENAETHLYGMAITDKKERIDNHSNIEHKVPHCQSNQLFKYILDGQSIGAFSGRIVVFQDAQKTQAYQNNRNLCGSRECRMFSKPQLEIYADDVKCSHGLTTGQLDENALFYLRSRGIPVEEARLLLKFAFAHDIIEGIRLEGLRDRLKMLVEKRFRGELIKCKTCF